MPDSKQRCGIPKGNTVAIVGDPGTGKTMLLLSFFLRARSENGALRLAGGKQDCAADEGPWNAFDRLFELQVSEDQSGQEEQNQKSSHLRIFISLENPFSRMWDHHEALLKPIAGKNGLSECDEETNRAQCSGDDVYVFIDATSLLSGRLEDMLRYPRLDNDNANDSNRPKLRERKLHLAPCGARNQDPSRCWFTHDDERGVQSLENLTQEPDSFFPKLKPKESGSSQGVHRLRLITLVTPPVPDPSERVRLLKDLLAALLVMYGKSCERVLALDSLSALLHPFAQLPGNSGSSGFSAPSEASPGETSPRRLHMLNLVRWLEEQKVTTMMACEARRTENNTLRGHPLFLGTEERYLASGVIQLDYHRYPSGDLMRYMRVLKMRGAGHDMRGHAYDLSAEGLAWLEVLFGEAQQGGLHD